MIIYNDTLRTSNKCQYKQTVIVTDAAATHSNLAEPDQTSPHFHAEISSHFVAAEVGKSV